MAFAIPGVACLAMGWLFAVALGLHRQSRGVVLAALLPIAVGHALAVLGVSAPESMAREAAAEGGAA